MKTPRYLGDSNKNRLSHVHDLDNRKPSCSIESIRWAGHDVAFRTREEAFAAGYVPCIFCLPYEKGAS